MVSLKRHFYGLPFMKAYRIWRAHQIARNPRPVREGFSFASYDMAFTEGWERAERALIAQLLPDCAALIDVGANSGFYSLLAAHLGKPAIAVEPDAGNLILLRANVGSSPVEVVAAALSDRPGTIALYGDGDMASFDPDWQGVGRYFRQTVPTVTLDALLAGRWADERLVIKVDVEGAEALVLRGAAETLARQPRPCWLIESLPDLPTGAANPAHGQTLAIMAAAGYAMREVSPGNLLFS